MNKRVLSGIAGFWLLLSMCAWSQVNVKPMSMPKMQFFDANGNPLAGGFVYSYSAGTTTPLATYTDSTGVTPNANPVVLDSGGFASIWLGPSSYKFVVKNSAGVQVYSQDNIPGNLITSTGLPFAGSSSGTTTVQASSIASGTLTLPAATDTLVGRATTDTLSNKTLTAPALTAPVIGGGQTINAVYRGVAAGLNSSFTAIAANSCQEQTITLTGVSTNGAVSVNPTASPGSAFAWSSWINGTNTIVVRLCNVTAGSSTPTSVTWNVAVIQ